MSDKGSRTGIGKLILHTKTEVYHTPASLSAQMHANLDFKKMYSDSVLQKLAWSNK